MVGFLAAPGADAVLGLVPNAGEEDGRDVQVTLRHRTVEMVVAVVERVDDVLGRRELAVVLREAPVIGVAFQHDLVRREGLEVIRARNDRYGVVLELGNLAEVVALALLGRLDQRFEDGLRQDRRFGNRVEDNQRVLVVLREVERNVVVAFGSDGLDVEPVAMTRCRQDGIYIECIEDVFDRNRFPVVPLGPRVEMDYDGGIRLDESIGKHRLEITVKLVVRDERLVHQAHVPVNREVRVVIERIERRRRSPVETPDI